MDYVIIRILGGERRAASGERRDEREEKRNSFHIME
jgi:hypothetical protein